MAAATNNGDNRITATDASTTSVRRFTARDAVRKIDRSMWTRGIPQTHCVPGTTPTLGNRGTTKSSSAPALSFVSIPAMAASERSGSAITTFVTPRSPATKGRSSNFPSSGSTEPSGSASPTKPLGRSPYSGCESSTRASACPTSPVPTIRHGSHAEPRTRARRSAAEPTTLPASTPPIATGTIVASTRGEPSTKGTSTRSGSAMRWSTHPTSFTTVGWRRPRRGASRWSEIRAKRA